MAMFVQKLKGGFSDNDIPRMAPLPGAPRLKLTNYFKFPPEEDENTPSEVQKAELEGIDSDSSSGSDNVFYENLPDPPKTPGFEESNSEESNNGERQYDYYKDKDFKFKPQDDDTSSDDESAVADFIKCQARGLSSSESDGEPYSRQKMSSPITISDSSSGEEDVVKQQFTGKKKRGISSTGNSDSGPLRRRQRTKHPHEYDSSTSSDDEEPGEHSRDVRRHAMLTQPLMTVNKSYNWPWID
nr:hypothetical protein [Bovine gammaherpesvirus 4]